MKKTSLLTGLLCLLLHGMMAQTDFTLPVQTTIETGTIEGKFHTLTGIQTYFGVPFAKAPVGALRWKAPQPAAAWKGVKETKAFGPRPVQAMVFGDMNDPSRPRIAVWKSDAETHFEPLVPVHCKRWRYRHFLN